MTLKLLSVGQMVQAGKEGTEDYDTGRILAIDGDEAQVGWHSGVRGIIELSELRPVSSKQLDRQFRKAFTPNRHGEYA